MVNEHNQVVCNQNGLILSDGVTIYPGYIEITSEGANAHFSNDPNNVSKSLAVLKNRIKDESGRDLVEMMPVDTELEIEETQLPLHFCDQKCLGEFMGINQ